jgi:hypothetical protein
MSSSPGGIINAVRGHITVLKFKRIQSNKEQPVRVGKDRPFRLFPAQKV